MNSYVTPVLPHEQIQRLRGTKFLELMGYGHMAGWIVRVWYGTPHAHLVGLPDPDSRGEDVVDLQLDHPASDVAFVIRFRAEKVGGHWGVYKFHAVRCTMPGIFRHGGSMNQVKHYMGANSMGCPR